MVQNRILLVCCYDQLSPVAKKMPPPKEIKNRLISWSADHLFHFGNHFPCWLSWTRVVHLNLNSKRCWFSISALTKFQVSTLTGRIQDFEEDTGDTLAAAALAAKTLAAVQSNPKKSLMDSFKLLIRIRCWNFWRNWRLYWTSRRRW